MATQNKYLNKKQHDAYTKTWTITWLGTQHGHYKREYTSYYYQDI